MNKFKISSRVAAMNESATLRMAQRAREMASKGFDIINLSLGEPDFDTPVHIKEKAKESIDLGYTKYTPVAGTLEIRNAISDKFREQNNLIYNPDEILVSNGAKQSFANLCFALLNEGDEVILFSPYWVSYFEIIKMAGGTPILLESTVEADYKPDLELLRKAIGPKSRMVVFSSPCNPTGTVFEVEYLEKIAGILRAFPDILVVSDEIYEHIIFNEKHVSIGSLEGMNSRTATINGFSKGFSMTGWRLGYMGAPKEVIQACTKVQGQFTSGAASFTQRAGAFALNADLESTYAMRQAFHKRRDLLLDLIKEIPEWKVNQPKGAFYILPQVNYYFGKSFNGALIKDAEDLALFLLSEAHVAVVGGDAFGAPNCLRISYSLSEEKIIEAIKRIKSALLKLK
ncbi:MAG: pyridoxal phosphate-dependent aminotransferase [Saprospiraceae bacterium]|nr:pyridoxal phosphate-dependent aminotransferase [Candidatus Vicinibacter affinis]MBP6172562.1 pyridoxal phosphate-dependent aminotransferase [Saprospiraceae bacterium]MBK6572424.1 pyridoxal phosphate-dependent aminotransferase [Candidatus Vicinibacter affinis]MBK6825228.1 pyridoxal phosphate-dependent aminotransferase [Candidatus Vicinibacter affinis]MBK7304022.1 pyridoxal phosphate-dependent aminotransferase [Candidatus Vicinibacter affinis]